MNRNEENKIASRGFRMRPWTPNCHLTNRHATMNKKKGRNRMRKARFLLAAAFILGLSAMAPSAQAGCFQIYMRAVDDCSNLSGFGNRLACGADSLDELAGCVRKTLLG